MGNNLSQDEINYINSNLHLSNGKIAKNIGRSIKAVQRHSSGKRTKEQMTTIKKQSAENRWSGHVKTRRSFDGVVEKDWDLRYTSFYKDKLKIANNNGFDNLTDFLHHCYWQWESVSIVGRYINEQDPRKLLTRAGVKLRGRGGGNNIKYGSNKEWGKACVRHNDHIVNGKTLRYKNYGKYKVGQCVLCKKIIEDRKKERNNK
jgi:hypothetical protein